MLYEWREYYAVPGRMPALNRRFADHTVKLFAKHDIQVVGFWETVIGTSNVLRYLLTFRDLAHREQAWANFGADPEWRQAAAASEEGGQLVDHFTSTILRPTSYSPMQ